MTRIRLLLAGLLIACFGAVPAQFVGPPIIVQGGDFQFSASYGVYLPAYGFRPYPQIYGTVSRQ